MEGNTPPNFYQDQMFLSEPDVHSDVLPGPDVSEWTTSSPICLDIGLTLQRKGMKELSQTTTHTVRSGIENAFNGGITKLIHLFSPWAPLSSESWAPDS